MFMAGLLLPLRFVWIGDYADVDFNSILYYIINITHIIIIIIILILILVYILRNMKIVMPGEAKSNQMLCLKNKKSSLRCISL